MIVFGTNSEFTDGHLVVGEDAEHLHLQTPDGRELLVSKELAVGDLTEVQPLPGPGREQFRDRARTPAIYNGHGYTVAFSSKLAVLLTSDECKSLKRLLGKDALNWLCNGGHVPGSYPYHIQFGELGFEVAFVGVDEYGPCSDDPQVICGFESFEDAEAYARELAQEVDWHDPDDRDEEEDEDDEAAA